MTTGHVNDLAVIIDQIRIAVTITASPMKSVHSSKPLLDVTVTHTFSDISDMNPKNRLASCGCICNSPPPDRFRNNQL